MYVQYIKSVRLEAAARSETPRCQHPILCKEWPDPNRRVIEVVSDMATVAMTQADDGVLGRGAESMSLQRRRAAMPLWLVGQGAYGRQRGFRL